MPPKVLVAEEMSEEGIQVLRQGARVEVALGLKPEELRKRMGGVEAIVVRSQVKLDRPMLEAARGLRVIGRAGVGIDNIDVEAATERGIIVLNAPEESTISAAEHTLALLLSLARQVPQADASMREGKWERRRFLGTQLHGKTLGIIGLGRVGSEVARRAQAFGMQVAAYDPYLTPERAKEFGITLATLDEVVSRADFLTCHTPLTPDTRHLIGPAQFRKMKKGVHVINVSRGGVIDEEALAQALREGKVAGAALDVFETEPPRDSPLRGMDNVVLTPHLGASTHEAQVNVSVAIAQQVIAALRGEPVKNAINMVTLRPEAYEVLKPHLRLAEKLGRLASQLLDSPLQAVEVAFHGDMAERDTEVLATFALKGVLEPIVTDVNYVNAPVIARQRSIQVSKIKTWAIENFTSLMVVRLRSKKGEKSVAGTVFGKDDARIVKIDDYRINAVPSGHMLVCPHIDKPRVIGPATMVLGEASINIAGMQVGRIGDKPGSQAVMVLNVDSPVGEDILRKIKKIDGILDVKLVAL
ncbi:MAG: phosphoglycerate dehydrogenase [Euryarchaeota archaeon]|nr:phosphoglycerate dehydrogenase [Euryarchaeota archaeon]